MTNDDMESHLAEQACIRLINCFAHLADQGRHEELAQLFTADARFNRPSEPNRILQGRDAIYLDFAGKAPGVSAHLALNILVRMTAPDHVEATSYIVALSGKPGIRTAEGFPLCPPRTRIGRFEDEFIREAGDWRFSKRAGTMMLIVDTQ